MGSKNALSLTTRAQKRDQLNDSRSAGILGAELVMGGGPESLEESGGSDAVTGGPVSELTAWRAVSDWKCHIC